MVPELCPRDVWHTEMIILYVNLVTLTCIEVHPALLLGGIILMRAMDKGLKDIQAIGKHVHVIMNLSQGQNVLILQW